MGQPSARRAAVTISPSSRPPSRSRLASRALVRALSLAVSIVFAASANDLESVDEALVLYVDSEIQPDGGDILDVLDDVIARDGIGQVPVRAVDDDTQSLLLFENAYSEFSCLAAWPAHFAPNDSWFDPLIRPFQTPPSFFRRLVRYRSQLADLPQCSSAYPDDPFLGPGDPAARLSFLVSDAHEPDWINIELTLYQKLGSVVPASDSFSAISTLICPRILQIRTPVRAAARLRPHAAQMARLIQRVAGSLPSLPGRRPLYLLKPVQGVPAVAFRNGVHDFGYENQPDHNVFDVYFDRVVPPQGHVHGPGRSEVEPDECLHRNSAEWPASRNIALPLDRSLRFVWPQVADAAIDPITADLRVRLRLDALAGRTFPLPSDPLSGPHREQAPGAVSPAPADTAPPPVAAAGVRTAEPRPEPTPPALATPQIAPAPGASVAGHDVADTDAGAPQTATQPAPVLAPVGPAAGAAYAERRDFETWTVIEAYEDLNRFWHTPAARIENSPVALSRADAVHGLLPAHAKALPTGFGPVRDFAAFDDSPTVIVHRDSMVFADEAWLKKSRSEDNRTAFLTTFDVPVVSPAPVPQLTRPEFNIKESSVYALARVRARKRGERCLSLAQRNEVEELLDTYRSYFLGPAYAPFSELPDHRQAVLLLCSGHGPAGDLTSAKLGPVLLRALHAHDPRRFARGNPAIRATLLHQIGEITDRRYYLFGHSILTHFQRGTTAGRLRFPARPGETALCSLVPGLRVTEKADKTTDLCEVDSNGRFAVASNVSVAEKLYHVVLPTTLEEQLQCAPELAPVDLASQSADPAVAVVQPHRTLAPPRPGCGNADELPDPYDVLTAMSALPYVFRAALDVAYTFVPPR